MLSAEVVMAVGRQGGNCPGDSQRRWSCGRDTFVGAGKFFIRRRAKKGLGTNDCGCIRRTRSFFLARERDELCKSCTERVKVKRHGVKSMSVRARTCQFQYRQDMLGAGATEHDGCFFPSTHEDNFDRIASPELLELQARRRSGQENANLSPADLP